MSRPMVALLALAFSVAASRPAIAAAQQATPASAPLPTTPKDPAMGMLFGILLTGGGQLYAERPAKALSLMFISALSITTGALAARDVRCDAAGERCERHRGPLYVGIGIAGLSWLYGLVTAPGDVAGYNADKGAHQKWVMPVASVGRDGQAEFGVALRF